MRKILIDAYLDYLNNYLTVEKFAEHNGLTLKQASDLIDLGRNIFESKHPEQ